MNEKAVDNPFVKSENRAALVNPIMEIFPDDPNPNPQNRLLVSGHDSRLGSSVPRERARDSRQRESV